MLLNLANCSQGPAGCVEPVNTRIHLKTQQLNRTSALCLKVQDTERGLHRAFVSCDSARGMDPNRFCRWVLARCRVHQLCT